MEQKPDTLFTDQETKKLIACLQLHSRLMEEWDSNSFLSCFSVCICLHVRDRYDGQMLRVMRCMVPFSSSLSFPWWKEGPGHEMSYPSSLDLYSCRRKLSVLMVLALRLHVQQTVQCEAAHNDSVLSRVFWLQGGLSQEELCFLFRRPTE